MTIVDAVKSGFQNALNFSGRSRRPDYWWFFLFVFAGAFIIGIIEHLALGGATWLTRIFQLVVVLPFLALGWRRLQDTGKPGWWVLVPSAIIVGSAVIAGSVSRQMVGRIMSSGDMPAMMAGSSGLLLFLSLLQVMAGAVLVWWMSRPSDQGPNAYGPEPRVRKKA